MLELTPDERRGTLVLLLLVLIGTAWDLTHRDPVMAPPLPERPVPSGRTAGRGSAPPAGPAADAPSEGAPLDLNRASAAQLDALPGIGPVLAGRIVEQRERHGAFGSADELLAVRGIGPRLLERLRPLVAVDRAGRKPGSDSLHFARPRGE